MPKLMVGKKITIFLAIALLIAPGISYAQTLGDDDRESLLLQLTERLEFLQRVLLERENFFKIGAIPKSDDDPDYFTFTEVGGHNKVFGSEETSLMFNTDGSVDQLLILADCDDIDAVVRINGNQCENFNWVSGFKETDGIRTFTVPIAINTKSDHESLQVTFYACRFNGCQKEFKTKIRYKEEQTFADLVRIYDRYEWVYEWNDNTYHVQEVLLDFPSENIKKVKLDVDCEGSGLYIRTDEENRATCYSSRDYSQVDFGEVQVDDLGNVFNLIVESVTDEEMLTESGQVTMTFTFINQQNRVIYTTEHVPVQLDDELE